MEYFDIVDENGIPTGRIVARKEAHEKGQPHRSAHVWITRKKDGKTEVLLQKRSQNKDSFPGMYDTSSAGHIPAGQEPEESALRELMEELGISAEPEDLAFIGTFHIRFEKVFHGRLFRDDEIAWVYRLEKEIDERTLVLQEEEVEDYAWFDPYEVADEVKNGSLRFCVPLEGMNLLLADLARRKAGNKA